MKKEKGCTSGKIKVNGEKVEGNKKKGEQMDEKKEKD